MTVFALAITPSIRARRHGHLTAHPRRSESARGRVGGAKVTRAPLVVLAQADTIRGLICSTVLNNFVGG